MMYFKFFSEGKKFYIMRYAVLYDDPAIAKECRTCAGRVEHAIRHAIHTSWEKGDVRQQRMVFGYDRESGNRPTNAEFIARMIDCLERQDHLLYS